MGTRTAISLNPRKGIFLRQVAYSERDVRSKSFQTDNNFFTHVSYCLLQDKRAKPQGERGQYTKKKANG
jgi:hypothetical protein